MPAAAGAVYRPVALMLPPAAPSRMVQVTALLARPVTTAVNCSLPPSSTAPFFGVTRTPTVTGVEPPAPGEPPLPAVEELPDEEVLDSPAVSEPDEDEPDEDEPDEDEDAPAASEPDPALFALELC